MNTDEREQLPSYKCVVRFEKRLFLTTQLIFGIVLCAGWYCSAKWYWLVVLGLPIELASISIMWWPTIEPANGILREQALLFGKKFVAERIIPLNEFSEVFYEYIPSSDNDTNFRLGLLHSTGRKFWVQGSWVIRRAVEETAWELSCRTGIKLREWPV